MSDRIHIAVVDDERDIRETVAEYLEINGYRVSKADGGTALRRLVEQSELDLVVLDITMPGEDGLSLARHLREKSGAGVIMLTARDAVVERVVGIEMGADDYVTKPFDLRELLARVKAVLRRVRRTADGAVDASQRVRFGDHLLDLGAHKLFDGAGAEVAITAMEFDLLRTFAERPNRVLSREQLLDLAHNRDSDPFDRSIDIRIARLRRKIEPDPKTPRVIKTVRGAGYLFVPAKAAG
ncbi:response regulator transcription factor [Thalassobaculum sp. OXR-137]|uniref:response regulator transcription factor n=1 Tax=Thalassobaculum sp. OXR-137 TaxID=3100173 RepID=UPI002AC8EA82|nr:response regulator transcription factor [Thalassobaculum sp. OXR-137]WPZ32928.1 response regulator transcription factor [Thalassobaculum sp. OXR-137]